MRLIRATPSSDEPSDRTGGTPVRTGQRNYGSVPLHCESCPRPAGLYPGGALASENPPGVPVPELAHCRRPHRPAPAASCEDRGTGRETLPQAVGPPGRAARPRFDSHRWHWLRSLRPLTAWPAHHRLSAAPSHICRDPRGWDRSARPFFCRLLGAIQQHFIPVDSPQSFIAVGQLSPGSPKGIECQPDREPSLHGFVGRQARRQHSPPPPRRQDLEHGMQTLPVVVGRTPVATPDHRRENRRKECPHVLGYLTGKVRQLPTLLLPLCALDPLRIM
jgi:hypothetical protein